ncbi:MAG TPA: aminotransferase class V-fold PLP-dependent enzyme [Tepidisphaeraceae bacterium]|jgi:cysteine desulfurase|nr:aminotransferase class V-fold PLP-dependent enzyme [Tepidisphaeraceae bacterium]
MLYLDCAATTPLDPRVREEVMRFLGEEFGNSGSRTHDYGVRARRAVEQARDRIAAVVMAGRGDIVFTSGATESNNLALLGLAEHGRTTGRTHLVSTLIEHPAVLEPLRWLSERGFSLTLVAPGPGGRVDAHAVHAAVRNDTLLVSVMQANNETGVLQPIDQIADSLADHPAYFHVDAAQAFGRDLAPLQNPRVDLVAVSGHKIYAPKGVGALLTRRRNGQRPPLTPLMHGGGQERGLRPGTLPVHLIAGFGFAAALAADEMQERTRKCLAFRERLLAALGPLSPVLNGDQRHVLPHIINLSFPGLDSEDVMAALAELVAISNGSACTSQSLTCSHVLSAMGLGTNVMEGALRWSWSHMTGEPDWQKIAQAIMALRQDTTPRP